MTMTDSQERIVQLLRAVPEFSDATEETVKQIALVAQIVEVRQGQTLLRLNVIETHAFVLLSGTLRLLAKDPFSNEVFTVGRVEPGQVVGIVDLLRQGACEGAIARQNCELLSIPQEILLRLLRSDQALSNKLNKIKSPCEAAKVLSTVLKTVNPPPPNQKKWILDQIENKSVQPRLF